MGFYFCKVKKLFILLYYTTEKKHVADNVQISSSTSALCIKICVV